LSYKTHVVTAKEIAYNAPQETVPFRLENFKSQKHKLS
jgi:hypothetical protein